MRELKLDARFLSRILGVAVLGTLAAGLTIAPSRMAGQEPGSKPEIASPASAAAAEAKPEAAQSDEEQQNNAFRLEGPVVKWTAKTLNAPVTVVARGFEVINFLIIALGIGVPLYRFLPRFLRNRKEKLEADIASARKVTEDANARLSAVEAKLASLGTEIEKFRTEVERESAGDEARIKASLEEESARIVVAAEQEIDMAAAQARRGLRNFAADLAIDQAAKQLTLTAETDRALIAEFVRDVAGNGAGGKN
ncbi:MAG: ATP synthase F0 subunit B [Terracidiphilus sp.]|nr:ATP synthase F0 subunit B [Terracidiphilus sp.]